MCLPARPVGNIGIEHFWRARPAQCRLCMRGESSGARTTRFPCSAMLHAPRQPNGEQLHGNSLAKEGLARPVRCRLGHAGNQTDL